MPSPPRSCVRSWPGYSRFQVQSIPLSLASSVNIPVPTSLRPIRILRATAWVVTWIFGLTGTVLAAEVNPGAAFETFYRLPTSTGSERLVRGSELAALREGTNGAVALFRVLKPTAWYRGLVPIYPVDIDGRVELRRLPGRGQENFSDPLFFALPPESDGPEVVRMTGRWEVKAIRGDKSPAQFAWELAALDGRVAGRFEQLTDFRFAYLTGGTFRSNHLAFTVEYISDRYSVEGRWEADRLKGTWRRQDDADAGTWEATHAQVETPSLPPEPAAPLVEWRRPAEKSVRYTVGDTRPGDGWERSPLALCRVWRP